MLGIETRDQKLEIREKNQALRAYIGGDGAAIIKPNP